MKKTPKFISKKRLIKILKEEPLFPGEWQNVSGAMCTTCAVGAVVRCILNANDTNLPAKCEKITGNVYASGHIYSNYLSEDEAIKDIIERSGYWSALSTYFEDIGQEIYDEYTYLEFSEDYEADCEKLVKKCRKTVVPKLIKMVNKYFPNRIPLRAR